MNTYHSIISSASYPYVIYHKGIIIYMYLLCQIKTSKTVNIYKRNPVQALYDLKVFTDMTSLWGKHIIHIFLSCRND